MEELRAKVKELEETITMLRPKVEQKLVLKPADVFFLFDRSGSMSDRRADAQGGYDTFITEQAKLPDTNICLWDFDTEHRLVYELTPADKIPVKDQDKAYKLVPRGSTALLDAITRLISYAEVHKGDGREVNVVIQTDGYENASVEATRESVKALIEKKQSDGWIFIYLGANQDAIAVAQSYGIAVAGAATYDMSHATTASAGSSSLLASGRAGKGYAFSDTQRRSFVPNTAGTATQSFPMWVGKIADPDEEDPLYIY